MEIKKRMCEEMGLLKWKKVCTCPANSLIPRSVWHLALLLIPHSAPAPSRSVLLAPPSSVHWSPTRNAKTTRTYRTENAQSENELTPKNRTEHTASSVRKVWHFIILWRGRSLEVDQVEQIFQCLHWCADDYRSAGPAHVRVRGRKWPHLL